MYVINVMCQNISKPKLESMRDSSIAKESAQPRSYWQCKEHYRRLIGEVPIHNARVESFAHNEAFSKLHRLPCCAFPQTTSCENTAWNLARFCRRAQVFLVLWKNSWKFKIREKFTRDVSFGTSVIRFEQLVIFRAICSLLIPISRYRRPRENTDRLESTTANQMKRIAAHVDTCFQV